MVDGGELQLLLRAEMGEEAALARWAASASLPMDSGSRPSWVASSAARVRIACRVRSPFVFSTVVSLPAETMSGL